MKVITEFDEIKPCAIALGNFDGVHTAHKEIIKRCQDYAKEKGLYSGVLLFDIHTKAFFENDLKLLTTMTEKKEMIKEQGIDFILIKDFDEDTMKMSPQDFFSFLKDKLNVKALFAGFDYTFGYRATGNCELLSKMCEETDVHIEILPRIDIDNEPVSSTKIRDLISSGKTLKAQEYLGHMYFVSGIVEKGKQNGTKMGIPTANVSFPNDKLMPDDGVYTGIIEIENKQYKSLINIGKNPTFNAEKRTLEVHIPEFSKNIYEEEVKVLFDRKIRGEIKFESSSQLVKQIKEDLKFLN